MPQNFRLSDICRNISRPESRDQSGAMRYITEIFVDNMEMLSPKGANTGAGAPQPSATQAQQPQQMQQPQQQAQPSQAQPIQDNPADDLPF